MKQDDFYEMSMGLDSAGNRLKDSMKPPKKESLREDPYRRFRGEFRNTSYYDSNINRGGEFRNHNEYYGQSFNPNQPIPYMYQRTQGMNSYPPFPMYPQPFYVKYVPVYFGTEFEPQVYNHGMPDLKIPYEYERYQNQHKPDMDSWAADFDGAIERTKHFEDENEYEHNPSVDMDKWFAEVDRANEKAKSDAEKPNDIYNIPELNKYLDDSEDGYENIQEYDDFHAEKNDIPAQKRVTDDSHIPVFKPTYDTESNQYEYEAGTDEGDIKTGAEYSNEQDEPEQYQHAENENESAQENDTDEGNSYVNPVSGLVYENRLDNEPAFYLKAGDNSDGTKEETVKRDQITEKKQNLLPVKYACILLLLSGCSYLGIKLYQAGGINGIKKADLSIGNITLTTPAVSVTKQEDVGEEVQAYTVSAETTKQSMYLSSTIQDIHEKYDSKQTFIVMVADINDYLSQELMPVANALVGNYSEIESIDYIDRAHFGQSDLQELESIAKQNLIADYVGDTKITTPTILFVKEGQTVYFHHGTVSSHDPMERTMTEEEINELYKCLGSAFDFITGKGDEIYRIDTLEENSGESKSTDAEANAEIQDSDQKENSASDAPFTQQHDASLTNDGSRKWNKT